MRNTLSDALVTLAKADPRILLLTGDHGYALFDAFRKECPDRYINCGIAEQNMVGMAAGLAKAGFRPIVYGLAAFIPIRVLEQIKIDICYENLPVIFLGDGAGMVYSHLGTSHQSTEDIAAVRALPHLAIYSPADRHELAWAMINMHGRNGPSYMRIGKADLGDVHESAISQDAECGVFSLLNQQRPTLCIATGSMVALTLKAIKENNLDCDLVSVTCLKPLDPKLIIQLVQNRRRVVTLEEHSVFGGLGGMVAEMIAGRYSGQFYQVGVPDRFSEECGDYLYLLQQQNIDVASIAGLLVSPC